MILTTGNGEVSSGVHPGTASAPDFGLNCTGVTGH